MKNLEPHAVTLSLSKGSILDPAAWAVALKAFFLLKYFAREASIERLLIRLRRRGASIRRVREGIFAGSVFFWREG
jgi:hypothetical protein